MAEARAVRPGNPDGGARGAPPPPHRRADPSSTRRDQVLAGAVRLLAGGGPRALTHRAVDEAAGLPAGSTSNLFRTRDALVAGVLDHILAEEEALVAGAAGAQAPATPDQLVAYLVGFLDQMLGVGRDLTLARRALFAEAGVRPEVRREITERTRFFWELGGRWLRGLGAPDPERRARLLLAMIDGIITERLVRPEPPLDVEEAVELVLRGILSTP
ncbi:TetR/AcrR family transcriptional regulator [Actinoalloteichus sp. AHMU CJ021]|uniref:Transcriptional regulator, TetR family n=1 Tax=Actinoalloteichus caeruleus DSM 43889 TaxID=1120930 RepID=A0ABT1JIU5_ACTCY|nr:TetR/AcrR family transcriptional regulator [Actinoalloteichus caeruleus]AUS78362.1 TetR/AcrR family transcriptional regulator [Actinoalloteichus sp. AHMU CJ021]MCP2332440.1 transcriptional regulator, TetR family [Actinoalloteichus caeruleus DSM 43889]